MNKLTRYGLAIILLVLMIALALSTILRYHVKPNEVYELGLENKIDDGGFENFNGSANDCCSGRSGDAMVFGAKSSISVEKSFSLTLTSQNHCACFAKQVNDFSNKSNYLISFYYRGDNPTTCVWVTDDNQCVISKSFGNSLDWGYFSGLFIPSNKSNSMLIFLYAESDGKKTITNLYDDLEVHKILPVYAKQSDIYASSIKSFLNYWFNLDLDNTYAVSFNPDQTYIIKTNTDNTVSSINCENNANDTKSCEVEKLNDQGYYLVKGEPDITLQFPWTELVLLIVIMLIVIRLLFKKSVIELEHEASYEITKEIKRFR